MSAREWIAARRELLDAERRDKMRRAVSEIIRALDPEGDPTC